MKLPEGGINVYSKSVICGGGVFARIFCVWATLRSSNREYFGHGLGRDGRCCRGSENDDHSAGTIFQDTKLPLPTWFATTYLMCEARKGVSANQIKRMIGGSYKTSWYLCHRIRAAMKEVNPQPLDGTMEMDETWVGGREKNPHGAGRLPYAESNKIPVVGIKQRGGELRFFHAEDAKSGTLAKYIRENVSG